MLKFTKRCQVLALTASFRCKSRAFLFHINNKRCINLPSKTETIDKFDFTHFTHTVGSINSKYSEMIGHSVTLNGWIEGFPKKMSKKIIFATFRDFNGDFTQVITRSEDLSKVFRSLKPEDNLSITGKICLRKTGDGSQSWEIDVENFQILNRSSAVTPQLEKLKQETGQYPPEYRYLQLRTPYYQQSIKMRAQAARVARQVLDDKEFTEIETPLLFKSTPEGAKEFLVPTRKKGMFYALPQSPQQYKQMLMASGFKGYYQLAKCFRDEDLRADRQPEFTQIDMEMSFAKAQDVQNVVQDVVTQIWRKVRNLPLYKVNWETGQLVELKEGEEFPKLDYITALAKFGIDKPDLRSSLEFLNISDSFKSPKNDAFEVTEACVLKGALLDESGKKLKMNKKLADPKEYKSRRPYIFKIENEEHLNNWTSKLPLELQIDSSELNSKLSLEIGDIIAIGDRSKMSYENPTPLGRFRQLAIDIYPNKWKRHISNGSTDQKLDDIFVASWLVDFPLFSPIEKDAQDGYPIYDFNSFESTHHPFTMAQLEDYELLSSNPLNVKGDHYDLVINGTEVGGGSRRVHDAQLQAYIFSEILKISNYKELFGHLLHVLDNGCPPHAGLAIGFDRMCSMLLGSSNIRDVVAFPKNQAGSDPVVESPSEVPEKTLQLYGIKVT
ncbi:aspartate--tRNA ligase [Martiniozyma asiatica (nom. inval.)]|nr:aspartate--tRNA ligase [Martiniozyma asiatica]